MKKLRLDELMILRGLAETADQCARLALAGKVLVSEERVSQVSQKVALDVPIRVIASQPFVGRGGQKLSAALEHFKIDLNGRIVADVGSSTGGFTDCMLKSGAKRVYAIDVGTNQLDYSLRTDSRVIVLEGTNVKELPSLTSSLIVPLPSFVTVDISFISVASVLESIVSILEPAGELLILVKPHFELQSDQVQSGGVVLDPALHKLACDKISNALLRLGYQSSTPFKSPLLGTKGKNIEFFLHAIK